jgi:polar amino acid transport system substrate-binding protein
MISIKFRIAASLLALTLSLAAWPATPASDALKKELVPTGTLRAAINYNNPLLARRDPATGELSGLAVDLSRELAKRVGVPLKLIPYQAAGEITSSARSDAWDIGYLAVDPLRAKDIDFTAPHVELEGTYLVPAGSRLKRLADVDRDGVRIAVTANSAYDLFLSRALKHAQIVRAESTPKSFELMREQKLDAVAAVKTALVAQARQNPGSRVLSGHFMTIPQAVGLPKGRLNATRYVSDFIEEMKSSGFVATALKKYGLDQDDAIVAPQTLKILATQAVQGALNDIQPSLSAQAGVPVTIEYGQTVALVERLLNGEQAPVVILTRQGVQELTAKGLVRSQSDLAVSLIGLGIAENASTPVLKTTADFAAFLKATPSIAYPARGPSNVYMTEMIEKLGLTDVMKPKTTLVTEGISGTLVLEDKAAAAVQQISELKTAGLKNIVPLPDEIQLRTFVTVAVLKTGSPHDAAERIVSVLKSAEAIAAYKRSGVSPLFK